MSSGPAVPCLTSAQAREADRLAAERFGVPTGWLMEAAGWQLARHCRGRTYVLCGPGNNGGDGLAAARHLHRWGRLEGVACTDAGSLRGPAAEEAGALRAAGVEIAGQPALGGAPLLLDALLGTGLRRPPEGRLEAWIELANASGRRIIAADLPSGLDADSGQPPGACIRAALTVTLGLPKPGLLQGRGPELAGELWIADIGMPDAVYALLGVEVPGHLFAMHDRVQPGALAL